MVERPAFYRVVGDKIRARRKVLGLSQEVLADAIGLKRPSMSNIEKGRQNLLLHTLCDIAKALKADASSFLPDQATPLSPEPNLRALPKQLREFVEAGINTTKKEK